LAKIVEDCLATGKLFRREEIEATNGSGQATRLGATVAPIDPAPGSGARGALCLITDITEVSRLREQVALKRNLESLGEMSAGLAHEFKNAIAALHGYAQLLQTIDHDERGQAAASALLEEVRNLSEMINAFLNFARPQPLQLEDVKLDELLAECARELQPLFDERSVECVRSSNVGERNLDVVIRADARMLRQALLNLMRNAAEAISPDLSDRRIELTTSIERESPGTSWAVVSIHDTGDGISAEDLPKIFIPFFTTKSQGHGVGLALAHRVIAEHGGSLSAANAGGGGATFTVRMPIKS
jgi:signal transduction histidine kinase